MGDLYDNYKKDWHRYMVPESAHIENPCFVNKEVFEPEEREEVVVSAKPKAKYAKEKPPPSDPRMTKIGQVARQTSLAPLRKQKALSQKEIDMRDKIIGQIGLQADEIR